MNIRFFSEHNVEQQTSEKLFIIIAYQCNTNQNQNNLSPHTINDKDQELTVEGYGEKKIVRFKDIVLRKLLFFMRQAPAQYHQYKFYL